MLQFEFISDSEQEDPLTSSMISPHKVATHLAQLPPQQRSELKESIRSNFSHLFSEIQWNDLSTVPLSRSRNDKQSQEDENKNNLKIYLNSRNYESASASRRGLRKRNFASTHPYLADQAHYLGLTSVDYLNDMYHDKQDLEGIVRLLNRSYVKIKDSNPKDEKYKSKNFYSILGMQSAIARNKEKEQELEAYEKNDEANEDSQALPYSQSSLAMNDLSDLSDSYPLIELPQRGFEFNTLEPGLESNSESDLYLDDDIPEDHTLVRVGGRIRNERSLLKGVLPESAKRLDIYKTSKLNSAHITKKRKPEYRKGLAIRKAGSSIRDSLKDYQSFVDDNVRSEDHDFYRNFDTSHEVMSDFDRSPKGIDTFGILSDSSSSEEDFNLLDGLDLFEKQSSEIPTRGHNVVPDYFEDSDVEEVSEINPMFVHARKRKSSHGSRNLKRPKKTQSSLHLLKNKKIPTTKKKRNFTESVERKVLQAKSGSFPSTQKPKAKPKKKEIEPMAKIVNPKELLKSDYLFLREPGQFTIAFEAESESRFVKERHTPINNVAPKGSLIRAFNKTIMYPPSYILSSIDVERINAIRAGKTYTISGDSVSILLLGERFYMSLIDKGLAQVSTEHVLAKILRMFRDLKSVLNESVSNDLYECLKSILTWYMILQEPPTEREIRLLKAVMNIMGQNKDYELIHSYKFFYPYFILIYFTISTFGEKESELDVSRYCLQYWKLFIGLFDSQSFNAMTTEINPVSKKLESFYLMYTILSFHDGGWWSLINLVLDDATMVVDFEIVLEAVYFLGAFIPAKDRNWELFYLLFRHINTSEDSVIYNRFLDIVCKLNQRFGWPIEEKLVLLLYSQITRMKFANFGDEFAVPQLIGLIRTRNDIPDDSFFERFLLLVYNYVSELLSSSQKKRLITKLITSSHYQYKKNKTYFVMFINRINFILLLYQLSGADLKNQLHDLLNQAMFADDNEILNVGIKALETYSEISVKNENPLPIQCYALSLNRVAEVYLRIPGMLKAWKLLMTNLDSLCNSQDIKYCFFILDITRKINEDIPIRLSIELQTLVIKAIDRLPPTNFNRNSRDLSILEGVNEKNYRLLHNQMGRIPLPSVAEENKLDGLIELCIKIWIRCTRLLPDTNWDILTLQKFPYIGNPQLREKYVLFFYLELSKFTSLKNSRDNVIISLVRSLMRFTPSKYIPTLMNQLHEDKNEIVTFQKKYIPERVTSFHLLSLRFKLVSNIISNIPKARVDMVTKRIYLEELLKCMNSEYSQYFTAGWYKEFCTGVIKTIQKHCASILTDKSLLRSLASELGILQHDLDKFEWQTMPLKKRLSSLHDSFVNALHFNKDYEMILESYTFSEGTELIYHLISIYTRAIMKNQPEKWRLVFIFTTFFSVNMKLFKFQIVNPSFKKFLKLLADIPKIYNRNMSTSEQMFKIKTCISIMEILRYSLIIFDGYKDIEFIQTITNSCMDNYEVDMNNISFFSNYKLFDIQDMRTELSFASKEDVSQDSISILKVLLSKNTEDLRRTISSSASPTTSCISFDFHL